MVQTDLSRDLEEELPHCTRGLDFFGVKKEENNVFKLTAVCIV